MDLNNYLGEIIRQFQNYWILIPLCGFLFDQLVGDPPQWPHPVIFMGRAVTILEKLLNKGTPRLRRLGGVLVTVLLVVSSYYITWGILRYARLVNPYFGTAIEIFLISTTLAGKSLMDAGKSILRPLENSDLSQARQALSFFVSRETTHLNEGEVVRGTVETLAENFVDGIFSPLLYACLGGAPLAMAFKAISTLDSMIGYKNERYYDFGWFSARSDDWANFLPARLAVSVLLGAGYFYQLPTLRAIKIWRRDAQSHPSPNGGHPESIVAGLLGVKLGGMNIYHGKVSYRAEMGDTTHELFPGDIISTLSLIRTATWLGLIPALLLGIIVH